ncbi:uncharacterized protein TNCV_4034091 [Trichonephila clavipes]|nr:uncharacterized protein TNCV_4034091 [Trichonephila clavipes]
MTEFSVLTAWRVNMVYALPSLQWLLRTVSAYSEPAGATFLAQLLNSKSPIWLCIVIHKNEVWANGTSEQTHMEKKYLLPIAIPGYRSSIENLELSSPVQPNASPDKNSRTTVMVSFLDVTGIKPCPYLSPNQNVLGIAYGTEPTLIRKEDTTPLTVAQFLCSLHHCKRWRRWSTFNGRQRSGRRANRPPL